MSAWRRARRQRAETDEHWWPDLQAGHATSAVEGDEGDEYYAAMLWLPNPDTRRGWECHGIERTQAAAPGRPLGFRRAE